MPLKQLEVGQKFKSYATWDIDKEGKFDIMEVVLEEGELAYLNHTDDEVYDIGFLGSSELVPL